MLFTPLESLEKSSWGVFSIIFTVLLFILAVKPSESIIVAKKYYFCLFAVFSNFAISKYSIFMANMKSKTVKITEKTPQLNLSKLSKGINNIFVWQKIKILQNLS